MSLADPHVLHSNELNLVPLTGDPYSDLQYQQVQGGYSELDGRVVEGGAAAASAPRFHGIQQQQQGIKKTNSQPQRSRESSTASHHSSSSDRDPGSTSSNRPSISADVDMMVQTGPLLVHMITPPSGGGLNAAAAGRTSPTSASLAQAASFAAPTPAVVMSPYDIMHSNAVTIPSAQPKKPLPSLFATAALVMPNVPRAMPPGFGPNAASSKPASAYNTASKPATLSLLTAASLASSSSSSSSTQLAGISSSSNNHHLLTTPGLTHADSIGSNGSGSSGSSGRASGMSRASSSTASHSPNPYNEMHTHDVEGLVAAPGAPLLMHQISPPSIPPSPYSIMHSNSMSRANGAVPAIPLTSVHSVTSASTTPASVKPLSRAGSKEAGSASSSTRASVAPSPQLGSVAIVAASSSSSAVSSSYATLTPELASLNLSSSKPPSYEAQPGATPASSSTAATASSSSASSASAAASSAAAAAAAAAACTPSFTSAPDSYGHISLEKLGCFFAKLERDEAAQLLNTTESHGSNSSSGANAYGAHHAGLYSSQSSDHGTSEGTFLIRTCGDRSELLSNGQLNPHLFVLCYNRHGQMKKSKIYRFPGQGLSLGLTGHRIWTTAHAIITAIVGTQAKPVA